MFKKRSLKHRYVRYLRRIWPAPTLAAIALSLGACASRPAASADAQTRTAPAEAVAQQSPPPSHELRYDSRELGYDGSPQLLPVELQLAPEFRSACAPVVGLPPSIVLNEQEEVVDALEPIASCLTLGPLAREPVYLLGSSELPGRRAAPVDGNGRADQLRSTLSMLGVPFENLFTQHVDSDDLVEIAIGSRQAG